MNRTKHMIAFDRGLDWDDVAVGKKLEDDLGYSKEEKKSLKGLTENVFFRDVEVDVNADDLEKADTIRDLYEVIWEKHSRKDKIEKKDNLLKSNISRVHNKSEQCTPTLPQHKITYSQVLDITRKMIACYMGYALKDVQPASNLKKDLYFNGEKDYEELAGWIDGDDFFGRYYSTADINDLIHVTTVEDLANRIFYKYIDKEFRL